MLTIGIRYLTGYAAAQNIARQRPEWPVHPGRVFMALVAAHYERLNEPGGIDQDERAALEWLEACGAPAIQAGECHDRTPVGVYVAVNDDSAPLVKRSRQEREFPKVWLEDDTVFLRWDATPPDAVRAALERLCPKVTRIGHSSSLVQMWLAGPETVVIPNWVPDAFGPERFRMPAVGTLLALDEDFNRDGNLRLASLLAERDASKGKAKKNLDAVIKAEFPGEQASWKRPQLAASQGYRKLDREAAVEQVDEGPFDPQILILAKLDGRNLGLEATLRVTGALRNALLCELDKGGEIPEWISGHQPDGRPSEQPHAAFLPLPFVGAEYSDGHLMGVGIALPRGWKGFGPAGVRAAFLRMLFDAEAGEDRELTLWENDWKWRVSRERRDRPPYALRVETWTRASKIWESVTPVVLHHYPRKNRADDVERIVREAFVSAKLPEPVEILIRSVSAATGAGPAVRMPSYEEGGARMCKYQTHVVVRFANKVQGPVLVGRGRYRGYGLFRPSLTRSETPSLTTREARDAD
jgi:CRISPR-associated protein Csb2